MVEKVVKQHPEQIGTLPKNTEFNSGRWEVKTVIKNTLISVATLAAVAAWTVWLARLSMGGDLPAKSTWEKIAEMRANPEEYRYFNLQDFMPENPEINKCRYFDPQFWAKVIVDPNIEGQLKLVLCPPQYKRSFLGLPID